MLQALNRAEPVFRQHALAPNAAPEGALPRLPAARRRPVHLHQRRALPERVPAVPPRRPAGHLRAGDRRPAPHARRRCSSSNAVADRAAVDRSHGVRIAVFPDAELARTASFVLAVNAQMPAEQLRARFPAQSRSGPSEQAARPRQPAAARRRPALAADGAAPAAVPRRLPLLRARPRRRAVEAAREAAAASRCTSPATFPGSSSSSGRSANDRPGRRAWIPRPSMIRSPIATIRPAPSSSPIRAARGPATRAVRDDAASTPPPARRRDRPTSA